MRDVLQLRFVRLRNHILHKVSGTKEGEPFLAHAHLMTASGSLPVRKILAEISYAVGIRCKTCIVNNNTRI